MLEKQVMAYKKIGGAQSAAQALEAAADALRRVGGAMQRGPDALNIINGANGVNMAFTAELTARITARARPDGSFEVECSISQRPSTLFWVCLVVGFFCMQPLWVVCLLYFMVDPLPVYQMALDSISDLPAGSAPAR
jgi:hypothetical protein